MEPGSLQIRVLKALVIFEFDIYQKSLISNNKLGKTLHGTEQGNELL